MSNPAVDMTTTTPSAWDDASRVEAWAGEIRVNVVRVLAIVLFYGRHLIEVMLSPPDAPIRGAFHVRVTVLVITWATMAAIVHLLLMRRQYPPAMKFFTSLLDVLMVTVMCAIAGGPQTPLVLLFFAVIAAAPLRLSLPLIYTTTAAAIVGYLVLLAYYAWYVVGFKTYYATPQLRIPRGHEAVVILCLLVAGLLAGQVVRQVRRMIQQGPVVVAAPMS
jgi:hypothetical protein